jgi:hypothetical protein
VGAGAFSVGGGHIVGGGLACSVSVCRCQGFLLLGVSGFFVLFLFVDVKGSS